MVRWNRLLIAVFFSAVFVMAGDSVTMADDIAAKLDRLLGACDTRCANLEESAAVKCIGKCYDDAFGEAVKGSEGNSQEMNSCKSRCWESYASYCRNCDKLRGMKRAICYRDGKRLYRNCLKKCP